jgi:hypothetical protein
VVAVASVVTPATSAGCDARLLQQDKWTRIAAPSFTTGSATMTGYDASATTLGALVTTNGTTVAATSNGGCDWNIADIPQDGALPELLVGEAKVVGHNISQVRYAEQSARDVWALGQVDIVTKDVSTNQPRVLYSHDGGRSFTAAIGGLPAFGRPVAVRGVFGGLAVLLFHQTLPQDAYTVYFTTDAGASWHQKWTGPTPLADFVLDPFNPSSIWAWNSGGVYRGSLATSQPLAQIPDVNGAVRAVDIGAGPPGKREISVFLASGIERFVSWDEGASFRTAPAPDGVLSVSSHPVVAGLRAISSIGTNVLVEPPAPKQPADFSPAQVNVSGVKFVGVASAQGFPLYTFSATALYERIVPFDFQPPPPPPLPPIDVNVRPRTVHVPVASVKPERKVVSLKPGHHKVVDYTVTLPPVPTPLDVFFMTDSTSSMESTIRSVQAGVQGIVDGLTARGIDLNFGVADFRDYEETPDDGNYPYKLGRKIGPIDTDFADALESIGTGGGTVGGHDAGLEAIYQGATGAGRADPLMARGQLIPPGQGAEFRPKAMKVILVATDDDFRHPDEKPGYPGPTVATVAAALRENGILLVGLAVDTGSADGQGRKDMEFLAEQSGAITPARGVDCDGDGLPDLLQGEPLVCDFAPSAGDAVGDAFVSMLSGLKDLAAVDLRVDGPAKYVKPKALLHYADVNVKASNTFQLPVDFRCTKKNAGTDSAVTISATSRGKVVASTTATLRCIAPPKPPELEIRPLIPPLVAAALVPPPPPPPAPVSNVQPNVNPNPNPNPQLNANAGFAAQDEQQVQLALAENDGVTFEGDLAMTGVTRGGPPVPALAWAAAFAMTGAAAFGLRLARRSTPAPAFCPREYR